jgi:opacity protein-like surface antigen
LRTKLLAVLLLLALSVAMVAPLQAQNSPALVIDITRTVRAGQYGVVHVVDQFSVFDNGTVPASSLAFGYPRVYRQNYYFMDAKDGQGKKLPLETDINETSDFYWLRVDFAQQLTFNKTYNFTVTSVLGNMITPVTTGFEYNFSAAPVLTQDARMANVTFVAVAASNFVLPANSTYTTTTVDGLPALFREYKPWRAYSNESFFAPYGSVNQYLLDVQSQERDIMINDDGSLGVRDKFVLYNPSTAITSLTITLPEGATNVMAYDPVGAMWSTPENPGPPYQVTVSPRYSLGIRANESFTLTLTYNLPQSMYVKQLTWWGNYNLTISLLDNRDDFLTDNGTTRIITPAGVSISDLQIAAQSPIASSIQVSQNERDFTLHGVTSFHNLTVEMTVHYLPFWAGFAFVPWIFGFEVLIAAVAVVLRIRRGPELKVPVPVEKLREFVGLYDERLALSRELVVMEEDVARGGLVKHEFRRRSKVMELRLDELNKSLMEVKTELRAISSHYDELIRRIDRAEGEVAASRASMNQVRGQYRAGRMTREAYDALVNDISKRIDRAEETMETVLITLREEAR